VRAYLPRADDVLMALSHAGVLVEGSLAGATKPRLPEHSFIAEVAASSEQEALDKLREILAPLGEVALGAPGTSRRSRTGQATNQR